jgi:hypothetical protein
MIAFREQRGLCPDRTFARALQGEGGTADLLADKVYLRPP